VPASGGGLVGASDVAVTGHSLGGHLAMIMSRIAPDLVTSTLTYNAPRFDTNLAVDWSNFGYPHLTLSSTALTSDGFFDLLRAAENQIGTSKIRSSWDIGEIINTRIEGDAVSLIGVLAGASDQQQLFSESINDGPIDAHDMKSITDALAVCNLFAQIDSTLSLEDISIILSASSNIANTSLETAISSVGELLVSDFSKPIGSAYDTNRDQLYTDIQTITGELPNSSGLTVELFGTIGMDGTFTPFSPTQIEAKAQTDIAYRYALTHLNPFAVLGADYSSFNQNGELDLYDVVNGTGQLSSSYLLDRTEMLANLIDANVNDSIVTGTTVHYADLPNQVSLNDLLSHPRTKAFIFGGENNDSVNGSGPEFSNGNVVDHLYGMGGDDQLQGFGGDDILDGGRGNDRLFGGSGNDTYIYTPGDGEDTISDTEISLANGSNQIVVGNFNLNASQTVLTYLSPTQGVYVFTDTNNGLTYEWDRHKKTVQVMGSALDGTTNLSTVNSITITDIDSPEALRERFGIDLPLSFLPALTTENSNPFVDPNYIASAEAATILEQGGLRLNIASNLPLKAGDSITLEIVGNSGSAEILDGTSNGDNRAPFSKTKKSLTSWAGVNILPLIKLNIKFSANAIWRGSMNSIAA